MPELIERPEFPDFPDFPVGDGPPGPPQLHLTEMDLPDEAQVNSDIFVEHVPDFILDGF